jgi:hypothetical protein
MVCIYVYVLLLYVVCPTIDGLCYAGCFFLSTPPPPPFCSSASNYDSVVCALLRSERRANARRVRRASASATFLDWSGKRARTTRTRAHRFTGTYVRPRPRSWIGIASQSSEHGG